MSPHARQASFYGPRSSAQKVLLRLGAYAHVVLGMSAVLLIWLGAVHFTRSERAQADRGAVQNASNLARSFEEHIVSAIQNVDLTLLYIRDAYARDLELFDLAIWERNQLFLNTITFQVAIIDANGILVKSNIAGSTPGVDLSDREHFKVHRDRLTDELFISKPVMGRVSKKWSIQLTRKVLHADGSFGGVIVVSVDPEYLTRFYKSIDVGAQGSIALIGLDGIVRARGAQGPVVVGASIGTSPLMSSVKKNSAGHYYSRSELDQVERLFAYRSVKGFPLVVTVGLGTEEIYAAADQGARATFILATILTFWLLAVATLIKFYQKSLSRALVDAESGTRSRSEFLATISHEIRTPMNGVIGMSELLASSGLNQTQASYVKTLRSSASHLLQIINDVLDFSKIEADRISVEAIEMDLRAIVSEAVEILANNAEVKGLPLHIKFGPDLPAMVMGDPSRLRQVILNILGNAIKFTETGHVVITCMKTQGADGAHPLARISISDTGIGIPADAIPMLFREFSQLDGSISRRFGGTGLGLAICKRLVELMGGEISINSQANVGTTVSFTIPLVEAAIPNPAPAVARTAEPRASGAASLQILVVEDDATNQLVASKLLEGMGHKVKIAPNGQQAIELCATSTFDIVFMDVMMPVMDGLETTRLIRRGAASPDAPYIIALTANTRDEDREGCLKAGMNAFLTKPITKQALETALNHFLSTSEGALAEPADGSSDDAAAFYAIMNDVVSQIGDSGAHEICRTFMASMKDRLAVLRAAFETEQRETIRQAAHAAKGSSATIGLTHNAELFGALEIAAPDATMEVLRELFGQAEANLLLGFETMTAYIGALRRAA